MDADFETMRLPVGPDAVTPDGSDVRVLLRLGGGSMAHFRLEPGLTSRAVAHHSVEEIWYILRGEGEIWRKSRYRHETVPLTARTCLTIPVGTHFQFRSFGPEPLEVLGVTMPPWPGDGEAFEVPGMWRSNG